MVAGYPRFPVLIRYLVSTRGDLDFLDRPADASGLAAFTDAMDRGLADQQVWADFLSSNEFFVKISS